MLIVSVSGIRSRRPLAHFIKKIGKATDPKAAVLISCFSNHLPTVFPEAALKEAKKAKEPSLRKRVDLRALPFVTIDGADAKDFDDAVTAQIEEVKAAKKYHNFAELLETNDIWEVK